MTLWLRLPRGCLPHRPFSSRSSIPNGASSGKGLLRVPRPLDPREIYEDTLIRCLRNTEKVQRERRLVFDVEALAEAACEARGARFVQGFEKIGEGQNNRVFLLTLSDSSQLVARLTFGTLFPAHLSNASEAATLSLLHFLGVPVPEVYAWSALHAENAVGAPYMLAERVAGVELSTRLRALRANPGHLISQLVRIRQKLSRTQFSAYGAIYFRPDVPPELRDEPLLAKGSAGEGEEWTDRFRIGPSLHRVFWMGERAGLELDRGPWRDVPTFARSLALAEQTSIRSLARPPLPTSAAYRSGDQSQPLAHLRALRSFLALAPYAQPPEEEARAACLLHPDFHAGNVFVPPEGELDVRGIIDWQGAGVGPLYQQMSTPDFLNPHPLVTSYPSPSSPSLSEAYNLQLAASGPPLSTAQKYNSTLWTALLSAPLEVWPTNLALLRYVLLTVQRTWGEVFAPHYRNARCPVAFSLEEEAEIERQWEERMRVEGVEDEAVKRVGVQLEGWVKVGEWERARERSRRALEEIDVEGFHLLYLLRDKSFNCRPSHADGLLVPDPSAV
ncbi:hypothetical protein CALVIDRAFT_558743 [Calocera viscosa TUFC12733]|uniref:Altered inheritance of mitochondria protein 9, mitochondrial n=1 Tax=Calocera viscosa (strain TUFC12733) TaxID=1330018 RepID=A0A167GAN9_CALVF|nr:hypothetical protein CALVIDRAFT_558743 [Calocera viscosa TUFC12733]